jgi:hypothetical protein
MVPESCGIWKILDPQAEQQAPKGKIFTAGGANVA